MLCKHRRAVGAVHGRWWDGKRGWYAVAVSAVSLSAVSLSAVSLMTVPVLGQVAYRVYPAVATTTDTTIVQRPAKSAQSELVTLTVRDSTVLYTIRELARQAHLHLLVYNDANPVFAKRISVRVTKMDVMDALAAALKGTGLVATLAPDGETVVVRVQSGAAQSERSQVGGSLGGTVLDSASGHPISGAKVSVHGTTLAAMTTANGTFVLPDVPGGEQMVEVRAFGYKPFVQSVALDEGERRTLHVVMAQTMTILSGVVTTATGQQRKLEVGSDITTINVDSVMRTAPISSVTDLLENRVPGLTVVHSSGVPGNPSRLLLRGAASLTGSNNPIVVIDGVRAYYPQNLNQPVYPGRAANSNVFEHDQPSPLDQIDPNSIETIEVLKGPSASALYGSDAANGVIVITTKHGRAGQTRWSVTANQGLSFIPGGFPALATEYGHQWQFQDASNAYDASYPIDGQSGDLCSGNLLAQSSTFEVEGTPCIVDSVRYGNALNNSRFSPFTTGWLSSGSATVSGGASAITYSFTGSVSNTNGVTKLPEVTAQQYTAAVGTAPPSWMAHPDDYVVWSGSGSLSATLSPTATVTVQDQLASSTQHRTNLSSYALTDLLGVYIDTANTFNIPNFSDYLKQVTNAQLTSTAAATLQWRVWPWLPLTLTAGLNQNTQTNTDYVPAGLPSVILQNASFDTSGFYGKTIMQANVMTLDAKTTIPLSLWRGQQFKIAVGTELNSQSTAQQQISTSSIPVGVNVPTTFPQTTATSVSQVSQNAATYGWFVEPQFSVNSRLFITPGFRFDGGTASGSNAGLTIFPKTSVSYVVLDHSGDPGESRWTSALSQLRLRGTFGIAGVQPTPGQNLRLFTTPEAGTLNGGATTTPEIILSTLGNTTLHVERSRELESGFDAQLFANRMSLTMTYYDKLRIDAIEAVPVAPSILGTYVQQTYLNVGNIRNRGLEVDGTVQLINHGPAIWSVNGQWSHNTNTVLSTSANYAQYCSSGNYTNYTFTGLTCLKPGYPLGALFAPRIVGYSDINGDGIIESNEIVMSDSSVYVGVGDPPYTASFGTTVSLWNGRLSLSTQGSWQSGMTIVDGQDELFLNSAADNPASSQIVQVVNTALTRPGYSGEIANTVQVISAIRWDAFSMTYTLPGTVARFFHSQQATVALQGRNLGLLTNYAGKDPSVNTLGNGFGALDYGTLPLPRTWQLTMRVTQ